jgi:hypothetical protein
MSLFKIILKYILINSIPAFCIYAGKANGVTDLLIKFGWIKNDESPVYQTSFFLVGSFIAILINGFYQIKEIKLKKKLDSYNELNKLNLNLIKDKLSKELNVTNDLKIRTFKVKKYWLSNTTHIENFHISGVTDRILGKNTLKFKHIKNNDGNTIEGVVGLCIEHNKVGVDYNAKNTHLYTLNEEQKSIIGEVIFCCAAPIFKNSKIKYIVSIDSNNIKIDEENYKKEETEKIIISNLKTLCSTFDEFIL